MLAFCISTVVVVVRHNQERCQHARLASLRTSCPALHVGNFTLVRMYRRRTCPPCWATCPTCCPRSGGWRGGWRRSSPVWQTSRISFSFGGPEADRSIVGLAETSAAASSPAVHWQIVGWRSTFPRARRYRSLAAGRYSQAASVFCTSVLCLVTLPFGVTISCHCWRVS